MTTDRWQLVERIYHSALEREGEERAAFLAKACSGDDLLRQDVESLLAYEKQAENFMEGPALEVAARTMAEEEATLIVGQMINHYQITAPLGRGGMGEVYLAQDTRLQRKVALKFLPAHLTRDKRHLQRFQQEARAVAALSHPHVCVIHEVLETAEGRHCIVMEYVEGVNLGQRIAESGVKVNEALDVVIQIASALSAAHQVGIVHRDIKSENIMLRRDGYVKVLDFGLAKLTERQVSLVNTEAPTMAQTSPGIVMGTVSYMSPEQARGLPVDARTDIWSLGVVLYELVTGRRPFDGATATDVIIAIAEREPAPLAKYATEAPAELERIVKKTLAKDRQRRYQTALELLGDLKKLRHGLETGVDVERYKEEQTSINQPGVTVTNQQATTSRYPFSLTRRNFVILSAILGVLVIALLLSAKLFRQSRTSASQTEINSLAVLPLENLSGDSSQDYFADGLTEALITDLAKIRALRVMSRSSVMQYKSSSKPVSEIARELNVDGVLKGSVLRSGQQVRIAVQLIHAPTGQDLLTANYEKDLRNVLALHSEVARDIVGKIKLKLTPNEQVQFGNARPVNPAAYDHYLRGQFYLHRQNRDDNEAAIAALEQAVVADPSFAAAHAELAQAYVWKLFLFAPEEKQLAEKAFVATEKALNLDSELAVAHLARGRLLWTPANHFPHEKAIREYRLALSLNPSLDEARNQLALVYSHIGAFDEAMQESQNAAATNPNNNLAQFRIGEILNFQGRYEEGLNVLRTLPKDVNPALVGHQIVWALFNLGRKEEASTTLDQFLRDYPKDTGGLFASMQAVLAASSGQERQAEDKIKIAIERGKGFGHFHHTAYDLACAYALMNKPEQAIKWLEVAADDGFPCYPLFERDATLQNLRQDPRFVSLLAKLRQQWEYYRTIQ